MRKHFFLTFILSSVFFVGSYFIFKQLAPAFLERKVALFAASITGISDGSKPTMAIQSSDYEKVKSMNKKLFDNTLKQKTEQILSVAKERKQTMIQLASKNPDAFIFSAISKEQKQKLPSIIQAEIEEDVVITGSLAVVHVDDFKNQEKSYYQYFLFTEKEDIELFTPKTIQLQRLSAKKVSIDGYRIGNKLVSKASTGSIKVDAELSVKSNDAIGNQKVLVIPIEGTNTGIHKLTKEEVHSRVFNGLFQDFMREQSFNQISFSGFTTDWIKINSDISDCFIKPLSSPEVKNYLITNEIDISSYSRIITVKANGIGGCSTIGKIPMSFNGSSFLLSASVVGMGFDYSQNLFTAKARSLSHEMGHALGLIHSNSFDCEGKNGYTDCVDTEYGNTFDTMGFGTLARHFNGYQKELLGWIASERKIAVQQKGEYILSLNPLESSSGKILLKIANPDIEDEDNVPLYVEFRQPIGFDNSLEHPFDDPIAHSKFALVKNGLFVSKALPYPNLGDSAKHNVLIDVSPTTLPFWSDIENPVVIGTDANPVIFQDKGLGITVGPILSIEPSVGETPAKITFKVKVEEPVCSRSKILLETIFTPNGITKGKSFNVSYSFKNNNTPSCGQKFALSFKTHPFVDIIETPQIINIPAGTSKVFSAFFKASNSFKENDDSWIALKIKEVNYENNFAEIPIPFLIGSGSPFRLTKFTGGIAPAGFPAQIEGYGFNAIKGGNTILISNVENAGVVSSITGVSSIWGGGRVQFFFPATMNDNGKNILTYPGLYSVRVDNGINTSNYLFYEIIVFPTIANISPTQGSAGTKITITGSGFNTVTGNTVIIINADNTTLRQDIPKVLSNNGTSLSFFFPTSMNLNPIVPGNYMIKIFNGVSYSNPFNYSVVSGIPTPLQKTTLTTLPVAVEVPAPQKKDVLTTLPVTNGTSTSPQKSTSREIYR